MRSSYFIFILMLLLLLSTFRTVESFLNENPPRLYAYSFTTSPRRISQIKPFLDSILNQTIPPSKIYANLPYIFKRDNTTFDEIPNFITDNPKIIVNWCEDIGPATKIIPAARHLSETQQNIPIISVDDDIEYSNSHAETFLNISDRYPNTVITGASFIYDESRKDQLPYEEDKNFYYAQLLEGFSGVLYHPKMFDKFNLEAFNHIPKYCYLADDLILSNYILSQNYPILSIETRSLVKPLEYGLLSDALHHLSDSEQTESNVETGNIINYRNCVEWLDDNNQLHLDYNTLPHYIQRK